MRRPTREPDREPANARLTTNTALASRRDQPRMTEDQRRARFKAADRGRCRILASVAGTHSGCLALRVFLRDYLAGTAGAQSWLFGVRSNGAAAVQPHVDTGGGELEAIVRRINASTDRAQRRGQAVRVGRALRITHDGLIALLARLDPETARDEMRWSLIDRYRTYLQDRVLRPIVEGSQFLVAKWLPRFRIALGGDQELDLFQAGMLGVMRAVQRFDVDLGYCYSTYASNWIRQAMSREKQSQTHVVHIPEKQHISYRRMVGLMAAHGLMDLDGEAIAWLAETMGKPRAVIESLAALHFQILSLDSHGKDDSQDGFEGVQLADPSDDTMAALDTAERRRVIGHALSELPARTRAVIMRRFGFNGESPQSFAQIGRALGCSGEWARRACHEGLSSLRISPHILDLADSPVAAA